MDVDRVIDEDKDSDPNKVRKKSIGIIKIVIDLFSVYHKYKKIVV